MKSLDFVNLFVCQKNNGKNNVKVKQWRKLKNLCKRQIGYGLIQIHFILLGSSSIFLQCIKVENKSRNINALNTDLKYIFPNADKFKVNKVFIIN